MLFVRGFFLSFFTVLAFNVSLYAQTGNDIPLFKVYEIKKGGRPRDPFVAPDGHVWFCGQATNYLAKLNPSSGSVEYYDIPEGSHPHNLIIDNKGKVWYAGNRNAHIGQLDPQTKSIKRYNMPEGITDPHTLVFDKDQNIWFTAQHSNVVGHLNVTTGKVRFVTMKQENSRPYGIKLDSKGNVWVVLVGTNRLARVNKQMALTEYSLPRDTARPRRLEIDGNDSIWYVDYAEGYMGRFDPAMSQFSEQQMPSGSGSKPYATGLDSSEVLWIVETGPYPNNLIGFDTRSNQFISQNPIKEGGLVRHTYYHAPSKKLWFGVDSGFIVSVTVN